MTIVQLSLDYVFECDNRAAVIRVRCSMTIVQLSLEYVLEYDNSAAVVRVCVAVQP